MEKRSHYCGELNTSNIGQTVNLYGWVDSVRDHGGVRFVDLRDREGKVQVVFLPEDNELFTLSGTLKSEYVVYVAGKIRARPPGTENPKIKTGEIEVLAEKLEILNTSLTLPFEISDFIDVKEELRLQYRYLDMRREKMKNNLIYRHKLFVKIRNFFVKNGFIEIETPFLTKSTPEGARDYLVPSRLTPNTFYALPQSPQLFKQILMISGIDKYYQIVRCFRDEDLRADRQPEFTQIDFEMSFVNEEDVINTTEQLLSEIINKVFGKKINAPFPRLTYDEAISTYGTDKPDLRIKMKVKDVSNLFKDTEFNIFLSTLRTGGKIKTLILPYADKFSRSNLEGLIDFMKSVGGKGLVWIKNINNNIESNILKFLNEKQIEELSLQENDVSFIVADKNADKFIGLLSQKLSRDMLYSINNDELSFVWIIDFPLFEFSEQENRWVSRHHPFTAPKDSDLNLIDILLNSPSDDLFSKIKARAYDIILNGVEIGGGSIRIHKHNLQKKIFKILNIPDSEIQNRFGFLLTALEYGAPPHGGIALGFDRLLATLLNEDSIREVIPFPKTQKGVCPLTDAPSLVTETQLKELHIKLIK